MAAPNCRAALRPTLRSGSYALQVGRKETGTERREMAGRAASSPTRWGRLQERGRGNQQRLAADIARGKRIAAALTIAVILPLVLVAKAVDFAFGHQTPVLVTLFVIGVVAAFAIAVRHVVARQRKTQGDGDLHR